jgi:two-component system, NarL family, nitrate/nitrite response regulator NarL
VQYETILVQRNALLRDALARFFDNSPFRVVASFPYFDDQILRQKPDLLLVDLGGDSLLRFREAWSEARVVALAERRDVGEATSAFHAGANAYLADVTSSEVLIKSLELVMAGAAIFPFETLAKVLRNNCTSRRAARGGITIPLSPRQKTILGCLADGISNKDIARKLDTTEATVKVHMKEILRKLGVQNRTQAAMWALSQPPSHSGAPSQQTAGALPRVADAAGHVHSDPIGRSEGPRAQPRWLN